MYTLVFHWAANCRRHHSDLAASKYKKHSSCIAQAKYTNEQEKYAYYHIYLLSFNNVAIFNSTVFIVL